MGGKENKKDGWVNGFDKSTVRDIEGEREDKRERKSV